MGAGETNGYEDDEENRGLMYRSDESEEIKHQRKRDLYEGNQNMKRNKLEHTGTKNKTKLSKMAKEMQHATQEGSVQEESERDSQSSG